AHVPPRPPRRGGPGPGPPGREPGAGRRGASRLEALTEPGSEMLPARAPSRPRPLGRMWETGPGSGLEGEEGLGHRLEGGGPGLRRPTRAHDELGEAGVDELLQPP